MFKLIGRAIKPYSFLLLLFVSFNIHPMILDHCSIFDVNGNETKLDDCHTNQSRFVSGKNPDDRGTNWGSRYFIDNKEVSQGWFRICLSDINAYIAYDKAISDNTVNSYSEFLTKHPDSCRANEAKDAIESLAISKAYSTAKTVNTIAAYTLFIKDYPNAPQAKEAQDIIWQAAFEQAKRTNTTSAYTQFIKNYSNASQIGEAKDHVSKLLETPIRSAESAYKCEDAKRLNDQFASADMPSIFDFDRCVAERKFHNVLTGANPQSMYLAGVKYENDGERGKAKKVYLTIMDKFSEHAMALKAADRLAGMNDVAAVEDAQWRTRQAIENSNEQARRASQEAANRQDRSRRDFCSGKYSCESSCNGLRGNSYLHCNSACKATYSGC